MLKAEARWVGSILEKMNTENISPLLNIGSATAEFREQVQPWIDQDIFASLRRRGVTIRHLDIQEGPGIDLHGDLTDDSFMADLYRYGYRALLCCNLLEHVADPASIAAKLERLVPVAGHLIVTVPNRFPYHPDPIDTMFRPDVASLATLFSHCRLVHGNVIDCGTGWDYVGRKPQELIARVKHRLSGMREHGGVKGSASFMPWLCRQFRQTCILLEKQTGAS